MNVSSLDLMNYKPGILISGVREWTTLASSGVFNVLIQIYCIMYWFTRHPNWNNNRANWRVSSLLLLVFYALMKIIMRHGMSNKLVRECHEIVESVWKQESKSTEWNRPKNARVAWFPTCKEAPEQWSHFVPACKTQTFEPLHCVCDFEESHWKIMKVLSHNPVSTKPVRKGEYRLDHQRRHHNCR